MFCSAFRHSAVGAMMPSTAHGLTFEAGTLTSHVLCQSNHISLISAPTPGNLRQYCIPKAKVQSLSFRTESYLLWHFSYFSYLFRLTRGLSLQLHITYRDILLRSSMSHASRLKFQCLRQISYGMPQGFGVGTFSWKWVTVLG